MTSIMRFDQWQNSLGQPYNAVVQVKQSYYDSYISCGVGEYTLMSVNITPKLPGSKIYLSAIITHGFNATVDNNDPWDTGFMFKRGTTNIGATSNTLRIGGTYDTQALYATDVPYNSQSTYRLGYEVIQRPFNYLDTPAYSIGDTITYNFVGRFQTAGWINRASVGVNSGGVSSFTVMEIAQ